MSALPPVVGVFKIDLISELGALVEVSDSFHMSWEGSSPTIEDTNNLASSIFTLFVTNMIPLATAAFVLTGVQVTDLSSNTSARGSYSGTATGSRIEGSLTNSVVANITFEIARRYRGGHPRIMLSLGGIDDTVNLAHWTPTFITEVGTGWNTFIDGVQALTFGGGSMVNWVSVSYFEGYNTVVYPSGRTKDVPKLRDTPLVDVVAGLTVQSRLGTAKRRLGSPS